MELNIFTLKGARGCLVYKKQLLLHILNAFVYVLHIIDAGNLRQNNIYLLEFHQKYNFVYMVTDMLAAHGYNIGFQE